MNHFFSLLVSATHTLHSLLGETHQALCKCPWVMSAPVPARPQPPLGQSLPLHPLPFPVPSTCQLHTGADVYALGLLYFEPPHTSMIAMLPDHANSGTELESLVGTHTEGTPNTFSPMCTLKYCCCFFCFSLTSILKNSSFREPH